jgi:hypothetical protein
MTTMQPETLRATLVQDRDAQWLLRCESIGYHPAQRIEQTLVGGEDLETIRRECVAAADRKGRKQCSKPGLKG